MKVLIQTVGPSGPRTLDNVDRYMPATAGAPFWAFWFRDNIRTCRFYSNANVVYVHVVEEEGDELSDNTEHSDAESAQPISRQTESLKDAQPVKRD